MEHELTVNGKAYPIRRLLGKGKGGYSYLVEGEHGLCVLKQIHHEPCAYYQFGDKLESEIRDYARLKAVGIPMPELLDVDREQERILKTFIDGKTIYELILQDSMKPAYMEQLQKMCKALYAANLNIDYFPTNFVVQDGQIYYVDFECNEYMAQWNFENWGIRYWAKTPEFLQYVKEHRESGSIDRR